MRLLLLLVLLTGMHAADWVPVEVIATAYCPCKICCGVRAAGLTSDNVDVRDVPYGIASVPWKLPYGTTVYIPRGEGYLDNQNTTEESRQFVVDDTGGALKRETKELGILRIDLRYIHHRNAVRFGRKRLTVYIWKD